MPKKQNTGIIIAVVVIALLFLSSMQIGVDTTDTTSDGEDTFTATGGEGGGGGGSGGVPPSGDPDEPCENCDLYYVENKLSDISPSFDVGEFLTKDGRLVPVDESAPAGHWECRGDCPDKNGYSQTCIPKPKLFDPADFNDLPTSKTDLQALMDCYCVLEDPCHLEYGNIFCERGIPENILEGVLSSNVNGKFMDISYAKIREHCGIARCEGGCAGTGEECIFVTENSETTCECTSDDCRKVPNIYPVTAEIRQNVNYGVAIGEQLQVRDFISTRLQYNSFKCEGTCIDGNEQCMKEGDDCVCKISVGEPTMPMPQPCSAVEVNGDGEWWKCLKGYCNQVPYCYLVGVDVAGWYMGRTLVKADNDCGGAVAYCSAIGTRSQGWYDSSDDSRITYDNACNTKSPCFYNTFSNSCECTPYTSNCAWKVDWDSFSGDMRNGNYPTRDCKGNCPYQITVTGQECVDFESPAGLMCKCEATDTDGQNGDDGDVPYCYTYCQSLGYNGGRGPVDSYSECDIPPEVPTTDNYNNNCCCFSISSSDGDSDMDNDGIPDNEDECPNQFGYKLYRGCPSSLLSTTVPVTKTTVYDSLRLR